MKGRQYNLKISFQCICMFSISETVRSAHVCVFSPPPSEVWAGYREISASESGRCTSMHVSTLECVARSFKKKMHRVSAQNISAGNGPKWRFRARQATATFLLLKYKYARSFLYTHWSLLCRSQNVYTMYRMRVISQNSRRKASAEGESSKTPWDRRPGH